MSLEIRTTADGSHTLFVTERNEWYHSMHGAIAESMFIYIGEGLKNCSKQTIRLFEVGYGTGLNALLTLKEARERRLTIHYTSIECTPLKQDLYEQLNYGQLLDPPMAKEFIEINKAPWNTQYELESGFTLLKTQGDFTSYPMPGIFDLIYFDAFSPTVQPEMWDEALFIRLYEAMSVGGILVTYSAKGEIRRRLQRAGFQVKRLSGPPGKREILKALKT